MNMFALFLHSDDPGFAQNAEVFGDIVLRDLQTLDQLAHGQWSREKFAHDSPARFIRQRFEHRNADLLRHGRNLTQRASETPAAFDQNVSAVGVR